MDRDVIFFNDFNILSVVILMVATNEGCIAGVFDPKQDAYELPESISIIARVSLLTLVNDLVSTKPL